MNDILYYGSKNGERYIAVFAIRKNSMYIDDFNFVRLILTKDNFISYVVSNNKYIKLRFVEKDIAHKMYKIEIKSSYKKWTFKDYLIYLLLHIVRQKA